MDLTNDLNYAIAYGKSHGVDISFDMQKTDIRGYRSVSIQLPLAGQRWVIDGHQSYLPQTPGYDIAVFAFDQGEWPAGAGSAYPLAVNVPTSQVVKSYDKPLINWGVYPGLEDDGQNRVMLVHELMHAYTMIANLKGFDIPDQMDVSIIEVDCKTKEPL